MSSQSQVVRIYRIENDLGHGPYRSAGSYIPSKGGHLTPGDDKKLAPIWNRMNWDECNQYFFGFISKISFESWMDQDAMEYLIRRREVLGSKRMKFAIYEISPEHVMVGFTQVCFKKEHARRIYYSELENIDFDINAA